MERVQDTYWRIKESGSREQVDSFLENLDLQKRRVNKGLILLLSSQFCGGVCDCGGDLQQLWHRICLPLIAVLHTEQTDQHHK